MGIFYQLLKYVGKKILSTKAAILSFYIVAYMHF